jgi:hypothetical protein
MVMMQNHVVAQMQPNRKSPASKFPRHEPEANLERAEQDLFEDMERAAELLQSQEDFGRSGVSYALNACCACLHARGLSGQALKPLSDLIAALRDVDEGVLPELFDPKLRPGQSPARKWSRSATSREIKVYAAACMDALMKRGISKDEAAARVARVAVGWPRVSRGDIKASTVVNWRDELLQSPSNDNNRYLFENHSRMLSQGPSANSYLDEILRSGPMMTGGVRRKRKSET